MAHRVRTTSATALLALVALAACTGPATIVENEGGHRVFLDGVQVTKPEVPFRYYGTARWDATPADREGKPDWNLQPASGFVVTPPPASPWLFPLDLPLELVRRAFAGREDRVAAIVLPPTPPELVVEPEIPPADDQLGARAHAARIAR